ncbi:peptidoglycan DD-metalloendopeptidase family protein [Stenotrophomonas sp. 24(2023)]|uniref:peptidoglycan DD-metalloendopeptidase family protein n=1 Tax=Stenotrophomonas sp. 24(2023) TaxID=3068324 RepID=UPI0027E11A2B|nr:peptidoglycan DD-metalloendopeptidase family protein [Stenotrophomonas sp. 24(2023)]WMJ68686.1 peptidoglycan DD-metalloendopeptidase family protein [Stenotrophomonas sp. 24(2023)]
MEVEVRMSAVRLSKGVRLSALALLVSTLAACGTATVVRPAGGGGGGSIGAVSTTPKTSVPKPGQSVTVRKGDTIYALARIHDITPADLIAWNHLDNPSTIHPGQVIRLYPQGAGGDRAPTTVVTAPRPGTAGGSTPVAPAAPVRSNISWRWPAEGQLVGRFVAGETTKQGVDIAGTSGEAVRAAANGVVVYSGAGLVGYGELIIIKHNDQWLSAYGHNRKRLVNEGQNVKAGDQIAEMGRTGANRDMLHFEIRYNGKPVDPMQYLPAK